MDYMPAAIMSYVFLMLKRQKDEEAIPRHQDNAALDDHPGIVARLLSYLLYVTGRLLVSLGQRMQQLRQDMPAAAPVAK